MNNEIIISQIRQRLEILYQMVDELERSGGGGGEPGTTNYNDLTNKPSVNGHILIGSKTSSDLDLQPVISDLSTIRSGAAAGATAVQPETGKGLSTNDYTTTEKTKLAGIAEGAEVNEIEGIKVNNTTINPDANKVVNITGLQTELSANNKLNPAYINYDSTHRAVSDTEKSAWNSKQNALSSTQLDAVNSGINSTKVEQIETNKNNLLKDETTIARLVDAGAKNLMPIDTVSFPSAGAGSEFSVNIPSGLYVFSCNCSTTSSASHLYLFDANHTEILHQPFSNASHKKIDLTITSDVAYARFDSDIANVLSQIMLCTAENYAISPTYQPYAPTNRELYEMILSLQSGS